VALVELLVRRAVRDRALVVRQRLADGVARLFTRGRPVPDAGGLEHLADAGHVADRVGVGTGDADAAVRLARGEALGDQDRQRLTQRRARDAQRLGEGDLTKRRTRLQLALEQRPTELVGDPVHGGGVLQMEGAESVRGAFDRVHASIV
jgi:hypothetical protein